MKVIELSQEKCAKVDDDLYDTLSQLESKWYFDGRYARRNIWENGKIVRRELMHRVINNTPDGMFTDHIDGDTLNNQRANLRNCNTRQNAANKKKGPNLSSRYKGVSKNEGIWRVQIWQNNAKVFDTTCPNERWAAMIYDLNAAALFGEYARLNFPEAILVVQQ